MIYAIFLAQSVEKYQNVLIDFMEKYRNLFGRFIQKYQMFLHDLSKNTQISDMDWLFEAQVDGLIEFDRIQ